MCTVTFMPVRGKYFITSNRDEKNIRQTATAPSVYELNNNKLIYPRDGDRGGSWIALSENGNAAVLLNGAFEKHTPQSAYRISRGRIFLEIISDEMPHQYFHRLDLLQIEPFTMVIIEQQNLYECRWDGRKKHVRILDKEHPHIWSSVTLYENDIIKKREQWFAAFLQNKPEPTQKDILEFHLFAGNGKAAENLLMQRTNIYATVSITSMLLTSDRGSMKYLDLKSNQVHERKIEFWPSFERI